MPTADVVRLYGVCFPPLRFAGRWKATAWPILAVWACLPHVAATAAEASSPPGLVARALENESLEEEAAKEPPGGPLQPPAASADDAASQEDEAPQEGGAAQDPALWRRVRAIRLAHWSPRDFRALVLLAAKARDGTAAVGRGSVDDEAPLDQGGRVRPAAERVLRMAIDTRQRLLLVRADEEQLAWVERLAAAVDVPAAELPEGEIEGLLAVRLHHARPRDVVNALRELDLYDSGLVVPGTTLLVLRVRRGARQQAADAIANLDMP